MNNSNNKIHRKILVWSLLISGPQIQAAGLAKPSIEKPAYPRFVVVNAEGKSTSRDTSGTLTHCIYDKTTSLTWEIKTRDGGLRDANQTFSWYDANRHSNGGFPGYRNRGKCVFSSCDTASYINHINKIRLCGRSDWRLPAREELRSLVDYKITYPGPTIDQQAFPNTISQFYWSSTANANDKDAAWGIGFSFGYDYAYSKSDHGYVRLVSGSHQ